MDGLEPFSEMVKQLIERGVIKEENFVYKALGWGEWVEPRVTFGTYGSIALFHYSIVERKPNFDKRKSVYEIEPTLPSEEVFKSDTFGEAIPVLRSIRKYKQQSDDSRCEAHIYWDVKECLDEFRHQIYMASIQGHFDDFIFDPGSNNFLFIDLDEVGSQLLQL